MRLEKFAGNLWIVISKEVTDALRDRRSMMAGLLFALLGPFVLAAVLKAMIASELDAGVRPLQLVGAAHAPGLVRHLEAAGVTLQASSGKPGELLAATPGAVVLEVPAQAPRQLAQGREATLALWADMSDDDARRQAQRVQALVAGYGAQLSGQRLLGAGVTPGHANALHLQLRDMGGQGGRAALVLGALPLFWLLGLVVGGSHVALDATGGERERRSLEALLAQPVAPGTLFIGKWLTASLFGYVSCAAALLLSVKALERLPLHEVGVAFAPDAALLAQMLLILLPLALLVGALQCVVALHARTHKEGQIYLNLLQMAPMALMMHELGTGSPTASHLLPMFSQHAHLGALLAGQAVAPQLLALSVAGCLGGAALLIAFGSRRLGSERFVFGL
ncbi:ABC transporter permease [Massilia sp. HP4]|uniref:ABC transporter permease n=1 Tax=Massilia sp. HP4 TaxID=2562316 RepID=UPI0010BF797A|nr:ABC transporter permease subunit [Massilia sp. HP4]